MPSSIQIATPTGVTPYAVCTVFSESREYVQLQAAYHDGTAERRKKEIPIDRAVTTQVAPDHEARLPSPGSLLIKDYHGKTEVVGVLEHSFEQADTIRRVVLNR